MPLKRDCLGCKLFYENEANYLKPAIDFASINILYKNDILINICPKFCANINNVLKSLIK